jgi:hypothetical protein
MPPTNSPSDRVQNASDSRVLWFTCFTVLAISLACTIYASVKARGLYADAAALLVVVYEGKSFFVSWGPRTAVEILRQAPIVFLTRYTSATLFQCGQVLTFIMLMLPTLLCSACWLIAPRGQKAWVLFPLASLLIGFAATSMHAVGEAAIATCYYWILLFILLFQTRSISGKALFLLLCLPAFWLHEGAFLLTIVLLACLVTRVHSAVGYPRERLFVGAVSLLLIALFAYQIHFVVDPLYPDDRAHIWRGLTHFEFLYFDGHFNLPLVTGGLAMVALCALAILNATQPPERAAALAKPIMIAWTLVAVAAILVAFLVEESFSPFAQLQARYHPPIISAALGAAMILLIRLRLPHSLWVKPATYFIVLTLCAAQAVADVVATDRWDAYVVDLQSRLAKGHGLIPWETTLQTADELADINWRLFEIGWVVPFNCIIFAPNGIVNAVIDLPKGTTFRPLDPERPDSLPELRGIDYGPYKRFFGDQKSAARP